MKEIDEFSDGNKLQNSEFKEGKTMTLVSNSE